MHCLGLVLSMAATAAAWTRAPQLGLSASPRRALSLQPPPPLSPRSSAHLSSRSTGSALRPSDLRLATVRMAAEEKAAKDEDGWTLDKVAKLGLAGVLSIAVAESVFWILSFPTSELVMTHDGFNDSSPLPITPPP